MKAALTCLVFILSLTSVAQVNDFNYTRDYSQILLQTKDSTSKLDYDSLLSRFNECDTSLKDSEALALLIGFTDNEFYNPYKYVQTERDIYALNGKGQHQEAIAMCDTFLTHVPLSQSALIEKSYAYFKIGQSDSADVYMWKFQKIMQAMISSGDGLTPETAMFALGPADGQNFIRKFLSSGIGTMGSGRDANGNFIDILEMVWEENGERKSGTLYFQIEHASATMFKGLGLDKIMEEENKKAEKKNKKRK